MKNNKHEFLMLYKDYLTDSQYALISQMTASYKFNYSVQHFEQRSGRFPLITIEVETPEYNNVMTFNLKLPFI